MSLGAGAWAFVPHSIDPTFRLDQRSFAAAADAEAALGRLAAVGAMLPNPRLLIRPYLRREAVLSSRIEGTRSVLEDLYRLELEAPNEAATDAAEVWNYVVALERGVELLDRLPLSLRFVRQLHEWLMSGVRGHDQSPGEFRREQNCIGSGADTLVTARYVPPPVPQMHEALAAWERFLHAKTDLSPIVECAMMHYQFEAIHPFRDGNGRVGRLLIPLFLLARGRLLHPLLYISEYFEKRRQEYYDRMLAVSTRGDWTGWIRFFVDAVHVQSTNAYARAQRVLELHRRYRGELRSRRATSRTLDALERLFQNPLVTGRSLAEAGEVAPATALRSIRALEAAGIVREVSGQKWGRVWCAEELLALLSEPDDPR